MKKQDLPLIPIDGVEEKDYINVSIKTPGAIGRKLAFTATFNAVPTLIGKITCLRTAMDYIVTPKYPRRLLTKNKLTHKDVAKIPEGSEVRVVNYLSILTHLTYVRLLGDRKLLDSLLELPNDIIITSFNVDKNYVTGMSSKVIQYNYNSANYVYVISEILKVLRTNHEQHWDDAVKQLIIEMKADKSKKLFDGVPFDIEFDEI